MTPERVAAAIEAEAQRLEDLSDSNPANLRYEITKVADRLRAIKARAELVSALEEFKNSAPQDRASGEQSSQLTGPARVEPNNAAGQRSVAASANGSDDVRQQTVPAAPVADQQVPVSARNGTTEPLGSAVDSTPARSAPMLTEEEIEAKRSRLLWIISGESVPPPDVKLTIEQELALCDLAILGLRSQQQEEK